MNCFTALIHGGPRMKGSGILGHPGLENWSGVFGSRLAQECK
jgi:hypothetical protein